MEMEEKQIHTIIVNKVSIIYLHKKKTRDQYIPVSNVLWSHIEDWSQL